MMNSRKMGTVVGWLFALTLLAVVGTMAAERFGFSIGSASASDSYFGRSSGSGYGDESRSRYREHWQDIVGSHRRDEGVSAPYLTPFQYRSDNSKADRLYRSQCHSILCTLGVASDD